MLTLRNSIFVSGCFFFLLALLVVVPVPTSRSQQNQPTMEKDSPPDTFDYGRPAIGEDYAPGGRPALPQVYLPSAIFPTAFVRDLVVSNTNPNLTNTDTANDGEPSIAINPSNPNEIVISAFSGSWGTNTPIWHSTDGGSTWTKQFTVPAPPGIPGAAGCPCDQAFDYDRGNGVSGTFLTSIDIFSGTTIDPTMSNVWNWLVQMGVAQRTNNVTTSGIDQPWLLVNRDPTNASQDNIYVAYDELNSNSERVAVSLGTNPPNFVRDNLSGMTGGGFVNPGHRLAVDPNNGAVYSLWQVRTGSGDDSTHNISYRLNRSTDGGQNWTLNGNGGGIQVATGDSTQACTTPNGCGNACTSNPFKFGTVNALLGGVLHAAVDPTNSDVYYVYGNRDSGTNNNRIAIRRLTANGGGGLNVGAEVFVTGQVQAALPSVAVTTDGTVGVLYTQFDGLSPMSNIPMFSVHFAMSIDQGQTFPTDLVLENFLSSATDNGACRQRVLGDYQQVKAVGTTFFGVFTGNGVPFGRTTANHDPIFFKVQTNCTISCPANIAVSNDAGQCGAIVNYDPTAVSCGIVTCAPASGSFFSVGATNVKCTTEAGPECNFTITVNDTEKPTIACPMNIIAPNDPGLCSANVNPGTATANDNCAGVTVNGTRSDGQPLNAPYPVGITTITWKATDATGNTASCQQTITVNDTEPPVITASVADSCLWPPNHNLVNVGLSLSVSDNCTPTAQIAIDVKVTSDERPEADEGDGHFSPDAVVTGTNVNQVVRVRAERVGGSDGRVYLIRITATDQYNNTSLKVLRVGVPKNQSNKGGACAVDSRPVAGADAPDGGFFAASPPAPVIGPKQ
jgi:hypothetical protein